MTTESVRQMISFPLELKFVTSAKLRNFWSPLLQDPAWLPDGQGLRRVPDTNGRFFHARFLSSLRGVHNHGLLQVKENIC